MRFQIECTAVTTLGFEVEIIAPNDEQNSYWVQFNAEDPIQYHVQGKTYTLILQGI